MRDEIGTEDATLQIVRAALSDEVPAVRTVAAWALARCGRGPVKNTTDQDDDEEQGQCGER